MKSFASLDVGNNPVVVVGFIGKSTNGNTRLINTILGKSCFVDTRLPGFGGISNCNIKIYHDQDDGVVYLNAVSDMGAGGLPLPSVCCITSYVACRFACCRIETNEQGTWGGVEADK